MWASVSVSVCECVCARALNLQMKRIMQRKNPYKIKNNTKFIPHKLCFVSVFCFSFAKSVKASSFKKNTFSLN